MDRAVDLSAIRYPAPFDLTSNADIPSSIEETSGGAAAGIYGNYVDQLSHVVACSHPERKDPMKRFIIALTAVLIGLSVTGCSSWSLMELSQCNCFTFRQGVTPEQFAGPDSRTHSWLGPSRKPQPQSSQIVQLGDDVWEVWVYQFDPSAYVNGGDWASQSPQSQGGVSLSSGWGHQEYVAFRNGRLESWGRGSLPETLNGRTNDRHSGGLTNDSR